LGSVHREDEGGKAMIAAESASGTLASQAAQLFAAFRDGDETTMSELVTLVTPILWHTARAQRLDHDSAQDVVQTVWLALVRSAASISDPQAVLQWLIVSTRREAWRVVRRADRVEPRDLEPDDLVASADDAPEALVVTSDADGRLWQHISELPERCRALLRVIAFADRPDYASVAESLGMPVGSIGPTRGRCLAKLRQSLLADPGWSTS
jgi:RNA polymerase sigma factor (sigma-70 family)